MVMGLGLKLVVMHTPTCWVGYEMSKFGQSVYYNPDGGFVIGKG